MCCSCGLLLLGRILVLYSLCLTPSLCPQSEDHVPEVPAQLVDACCERLEQEPSKELFKESTK